MMRSALRGGPLFAVFLSVLVWAGCQERSATGPPDGPFLASMSVYANLTGTNIAGLVVEVTAPDIPEPLIFNIPGTDGIASGVITLPAGSDRLVTVRAFDHNGIETHRGEGLVNVHEGVNEPLNVMLYPLVGDVPIEVTIASLIVEVTPAEATLEVGETLELEATVVDGEGSPVPGAISWGSTAPIVAEVDETGLVTALSPGVAEIVANFASARRSAMITVVEGGGGEPPGPGGEIQGPVYPPEWPLEGVTITTVGDAAGNPGGQCFEFTGFDLSLVFALAWGADYEHEILLSLDGEANSAGEMLQYEAGDSDLEAGVMTFTGQAPFEYWTGTAWTTTTLPTRLVVTVSDGAGAVGLVPATDAGLPAEIGGIAPIEEDYPDGGTNSPFEVCLVAEAFWQSAWEPMLEVFNGVQTPTGVQAIFDFWDAFYYLPLEDGGGGEEPPGEILGPIFPPTAPLEGVAVTTEGEAAGAAGGFSFNFTDFDLSAVAALAWGHDAGEPIVLALDGSTEGEGKSLTFSAGDSDLANGVVRWTGSSPFTYWNGSGWTTETLPTRATVTVSDASGPIALVSATDAGLDAQVGGLAVVAEDYPDGGSNSPFTVNILAEADWASTWTPILVLFDSQQTQDGVEAIFSFYHGFYYAPLP